ncbi:choline/carnitine O-acyltransferase [Caldithrix abyssi]
MAYTNLLEGERTKNIYEQLAAYPKPPLVPLPAWDEMTSLEEMGIKDSAISRAVVKTLMTLTGFKSYYKSLPNRLEDDLRKTNMRGAGLFALINSATLALKDDPRKLNALQRAATLIMAVYGFYDDLMSGKLAPDRHKDHVLEMGQYPNFFGTSLIIENGRARLFKSSKTDQITVIYRGHYFLINVGHPGQSTSFAELLETLTKIVNQVNQNGDAPNAASPGLLTGIAHPAQIKIFSNLLHIPQNRLAFEKIRHSFFTICLDLDDHPQSYAEAARLTQSRNHFNRWYHSSLQIVVFGNARATTFCSFNAYLDGNPMMRGSAEIQKRAAAVSLPENQTQPAVLLTFNKLNWQIPPGPLKKAEKIAERVIDHQQATFEINGTGKNFFNQFNMLPVPAFMVVLAMAAKQLFGKHLNIIQYLSMSRYRCMNLTNANATTEEVTQFVDYVQNEGFNPQQALELFKKAIDSQRTAYRAARKYFPPSKIISLFVNTRKGFARLWVNLLLGVSVLILKIAGKYQPQSMDIPVSHPDIFEEIPVVGRPGIRLPYARYFGLHYQIWDDKIVLTYMPGVTLKYSNEELTKALENNLTIVKQILEKSAVFKSGVSS